MNALGHFAIKPFHFRRRFTRCRLFVTIFSRCRFRFAGGSPRGARILLQPLDAGMFFGHPLSDLRFQLIEFCVTHSHEMEVAPFKRSKLGAQVCGTQLSFSPLHFERGLFPALARMLPLFRFYSFDMRLQRHGAGLRPFVTDDASCEAMLSVFPGSKLSL